MPLVTPTLRQLVSPLSPRSSPLRVGPSSRTSPIDLSSSPWTWAAARDTPRISSLRCFGRAARSAWTTPNPYISSAPDRDKRHLLHRARRHGGALPDRHHRPHLLQVPANPLGPSPEPGGEVINATKTGRGTPAR